MDFGASEGQTNSKYEYKTPNLCSVFMCIALFTEKPCFFMHAPDMRSICIINKMMTYTWSFILLNNISGLHCFDMLCIITRRQIREHVPTLLLLLRIEGDCYRHRHFSRSSSFHYIHLSMSLGTQPLVFYDPPPHSSPRIYENLCF